MTTTHKFPSLARGGLQGAGGAALALRDDRVGAVARRTHHVVALDSAPLTAGQNMCKGVLLLYHSTDP